MRDWLDLLIDRLDGIIDSIAEINERPSMRWRGWVFIAPVVGGLTAAVASSLVAGELDWAHTLPTAGGIMLGLFVGMLLARASRARR